MEEIKNIDQVEKILKENNVKTEDINTFNRFWNKVDIKGNTKECWNWTANISIYEYEYECSKFWFNNKMMRTNRAAYMLSKGDIPNNMIVMHLCNNPICCNPNHLKLGTLSENSRYMVECNRWNNYGENNGNSKLTETDVRKILKLYGEQRKLYPNLKQWQIIKYITQKYEIEIDATCINRIINGKSWHDVYKDVHKDLEKANLTKNVCFYGNTNGSILAEDDVREIHTIFKEQRIRFKQWQIVDQLAYRFKISKGQINRILRGDSWYHIYKELHEE